MQIPAVINVICVARQQIEGHCLVGLLTMSIWATLRARVIDNDHFRSNVDIKLRDWDLETIP